MLLTNRKSPRGSSTAAIRLPGWWYLHISGSDHFWHSPPASHSLSFQPFIAPSLTLVYQVFPHCFLLFSRALFIRHHLDAPPRDPPSALFSQYPPVCRFVTYITVQQSFHCSENSLCRIKSKKIMACVWRTQLLASKILKSIILDNITKCGKHAKR